MNRRVFVVLALLALVFVFALAGMASASVVLTSVAIEAPAGFPTCFATDFLEGGGHVGIAGSATYAALGDPNARAWVSDSRGKIIALSPSTAVPGMVTAKKFGVGKVLCSPEPQLGTPYVWDYLSGTVTPLSGLQSNSIMYASDGAGSCVGQKIGKGEPVLRKPDGTIVNLQNSEGGTGCKVWGMNKALESCGTAAVLSGSILTLNGVVWNSSGEIIADLGRDVEPWAISDTGQVVGVKSTEEGYHAAVSWTKDGGIEFVEDLGLYPTFTAVNNKGQIIGRAYTDDGHAKPFLRQPDGTALWFEEDADLFAINDAGDIIGCKYVNGNTVPTLWKAQAVPEVDGLIVFVTPLSVLALRMMRRRK